jgi:DHA1 family bicyclomycin/chloramphenicol resistance-like MFS transporter
MSDALRLPLTPSRSRFVLCLLGALSVITPLSIDMYLPAFPQMAHYFQTAGATISLSVSTYFVGLAIGQVFYGPVLDRFGRKIPLLVGLSFFVLASIACSQAPNVPALLVLRFIQGFAGCVASVGCIAMVRDFFPASESARVFSRLFLFVGVSPLLAPSLGGLLLLISGWKAIFFVLAAIALSVAILIGTRLPEGHQPDPTISLRPGPVLAEFLVILRHPQFLTYTLGGTFSFAGLFAFVAGSPLVFMEGFHLTSTQYSGVFALLTSGFIGASQVNVFLLRHLRSEVIFSRALFLQSVAAVLFAIGSWFQWFDFAATLGFFFVILACAGLTNPNGSALALLPFHKNVGSASALMGFLQLGIGAAVSTGIGICATRSSFPVIAILALSSLTGILILAFGRSRMRAFAERAVAFAD